MRPCRERLKSSPGSREPFHQVYGLFRLSVIAQQIYYRYHLKQTRNPAFKRLWLAVDYLHLRCLQLIRRAR